MASPAEACFLPHKRQYCTVIGLWGTSQHMKSNRLIHQK